MPDAPTNHAAGEPYVRSFEATVRAVDGRDVTLAETYFYAEGGGQPADRGTVGGHEVVDVQKRDGVTVHTLAEAPGFEAGETVAGEVDDAFRTYSMRAHTASHVVYGAGRRLFDPDGYGGFDIGEDSVRLDFVVEGDADDVDALDVQRLANEAVWDDRAVEWTESDADEARADADIVFNLRDDAHPTETVRIVEIDGWDISACGGTHVARTSEIGPIEVLDVSNPGADLVRVEYAVGPTAIERQVAKTRAATRAAETLDTSVEGLPERAAGVVSENAELKAALTECREELLDARVDSLAADAVARNGEEWVVGTVDGVGPNTVSDRLADRETDADVVVLAGRDGATFVVVATDGETDANDVIGDVTDEFGGGGGGQPTLAQGGGLDAEPGAVVDYLRSE
ncbi:alanyl-tRNA editing protein [Haloarcula onubensis]|uniref:DHHA1 domain-containing protein n=1 Tax=Haloarcula onubensis TaxID=2950539 RepID=A0ABU2FIY6_9EURY|nr:DHHA1 domain-containing protein [Halomicroarcula sp. S3CR25-11]MDS0280719.1 DHHA1 domain-containing protein [Halomicroarcula sp. S3CR25-11]